MAKPGAVPPPTARLSWRRAAVLAAVFGPTGVRSQFGGGGGFGGGGYAPPPPNCPNFKCKGDQKPVGKVDNQIWSYGCKESGMSFLNTASFDPSNPLKGMQQKNVDKCCVERDICKQTCGMSARACFDNFQKCSKKICKGDQSCDMQAMLSEMMSEPYDDTEDKDKKYDPGMCKGYGKGQKDSCQCVAKDQVEAMNTRKLKDFYAKFNPEKLNDAGEIKDLDEVWKKWKGKEAEMFLALTTKYKEKAVEIRVKPKPPPYKPPPMDDKLGDEGAAAADEAAAETPAEEVHEAQADPNDEFFAKSRKALEAKKTKAADDEDYDLAQSLKEELKELTQKEVTRLGDLKKNAIEDEDYVTAKSLKARIAKLEL